MEASDDPSPRLIVTSSTRWPGARLRRQAWLFWSVIVATVVVAVASVVYAGRSLTVAFPASVVVGMGPATKATNGLAAGVHRVTVVQPNHPVEVLSAVGETPAPRPSTPPPSATAEDGGSGHSQAPATPAGSGPASTNEPLTIAPPPAGDGGESTTTTTTTTTTTPIPTTTTTTWASDDDSHTTTGGAKRGDG